MAEMTTMTGNDEANRKRSDPTNRSSLGAAGLPQRTASGMSERQRPSRGPANRQSVVSIQSNASRGRAANNPPQRLGPRGSIIPRLTWSVPDISAFKSASNASDLRRMSQMLQQSRSQEDTENIFAHRQSAIIAVGLAEILEKRQDDEEKRANCWYCTLMSLAIVVVIGFVAAACFCVTFPSWYVVDVFDPKIPTNRMFSARVGYFTTCYDTPFNSSWTCGSVTDHPFLADWDRGQVSGALMILSTVIWFAFACLVIFSIFCCYRDIETRFSYSGFIILYILALVIWIVGLVMTRSTVGDTPIRDTVPNTGEPRRISRDGTYVYIVAILLIVFSAIWWYAMLMLGLYLYRVREAERKQQEAVMDAESLDYAVYDKEVIQEEDEGDDLSMGL